MSLTIADLRERALIARLRTRLRADPAHITVGIGDDAAVIAPERGTQDVVTTDSLIEHVHFRREWTTPEAIGYKALAVNLSDLAAMGATPRASFLSLALPPSMLLDEFDGLIEGYAALAVESGAALVGGNLARSPGPLVVDVTAIGSVRPRRLLRRSGARAGDELFVTGAIGASAVGLALLGEGSDASTRSADEDACVDRHHRPEPRLRMGRLVARTGAASAAMDLSDGLADAASALAEASGLGVVVDAQAIPVHPGARAYAERRGQSAVAFALQGGEDYELAFAVPARRRGRFLAAARRCPNLLVTKVGRFEPSPGAWLDDNGHRTALPSGFGHF